MKLYASKSISIGTLSSYAALTSGITLTDPTVIDGGISEFGLPMYPIATTTASVGTYIVGSTITIAGVNSLGQDDETVFTLTDEDGDESFISTKAFYSIESVTIEPQVDNNGSITTGTKDVLIPNGCVGIFCGIGGNLKILNIDNSTTIIPGIVNGETVPCNPLKIYSDDTTASSITVLI